MKSISVLTKISWSSVCLSLVDKDIELDAVAGPSVTILNPTSQPAAFACWWRPCGVTWDVVPEHLWFLKLLLTPSICVNVIS